VPSIKKFNQRQNQTIMSLKKTIGSTIFGAMLLGAGFAPSTAQASVGAATPKAEGRTEVTVTMPNFIILSYYKNLDLTFTAATAASGQERKGIDVAWNQTEVNVEGNPELTSEGGGSDKIRVNLLRAWAVRGLSPSGTAKVSISQDEQKLVSKDEKSVIGMNSFSVSYEKSTGAEITGIPLHGLASSKATVGDAAMTLDFANTTESGRHSGGSFTITAETI
jgi:hypothetical protein